MSSRRSSRVKQSVSYSGLDDQSDDDFADVTPPPAKKSKSTKKDDASKKSKKKAINKDWDELSDIEDASVMKSSDSSRKRRIPLSDKLYERQIQEALELSVLETGGSQDVAVDETEEKPLELSTPVGTDSEANDTGGPDTSTVSVDQVSPASGLSAKSGNTTSISKKETGSSYTPGTVVLDDSIEFLGEVVDEDKKHDKNQRRPVRRQAAKKKTVVESDDESGAESDFNPEGDDKEGEEDGSESDSDDAGGDDFSAEDSADSDFNDRPKKTKQTKTKGKTPPTNKTSKSTLKVATKTQKVTKEPGKPQAPKAATSLPSTTLVSPKTCTIKHSSTRSSINSNTKPVAITSPGMARGASQGSAHSSLASNWKPPARASPSNTLNPTDKSLSSGGLRLGLSRNQRVKPLHPSVKVS